MAERRVPRIRFKGFEEDWEQRKLGDVLSVLKDGTHGTHQDVKHGALLLSAKNIKDGNVQWDETDRRISYNEYRKICESFQLREGDVLLTIVGSIGECALLRQTENVTFQRSVAFLRTDVTVKPEFLTSEIQSNIFQRELENRKSISAQPGIYLGDLKLIPISIPTEIEEQSHIASCITCLDTLLSLHQRKLEKLKILKKAMLEKMFPKNGEKVPEIRFSGFADDWEQRKLGELADIVGGGTPSTSNLQYWNGDIDWYAPAEINEQVYVSSSQKKITKAGYENSSVKLLPIGTVLFTSRAGIGKTAILAREACTNQGFQSIVPHKQELDSYFIFSRSAELKQYGELVGAGSTFVEVSGKQMTEMELMMPLALNEQQAIGTYFRRLDQLLSLHQRKLEKLRQIKKSMLERMFV